MATNFPTSLDAFTNPTASDDTATVSHADQHTDANDAIEALQTKVGIDSSAVETSLDYKINHLVAANITDVTASAAELNVLDGITATVEELNILEGVTSIAAELNILDGVTSTAAELNILDGVTANKDELNVLDGIPATLTATELGYVDGVTSAIQTQLNNLAIKNLILYIVDGAVDTATGDGQYYITIPPEMNGMNLSAVHARVVVAGTTGTTDIQIANVTDSVDMLSTKLTIDSGETGSDTAATAAVIDVTKDDVATNDLLRIDVDAVSTTPAKGLIVRLKFV